ncbi:MAG: mechanosensitive ion channel domain-containing protein [Thermoproteus sp. AZ2]|jgi:small-conductance mechanosensitive channel|uniref:Mechanosensitive ion channel domain-containing protein n=1 Tax=Thermoproteus sp. AZ2 TaxID=1609232 RepID=A0ACC6UZ39_9CREN|nr:MAG: small-conductance mechanosensitive channel [Thermoproteus sp. AZ2]
MATAEKIDSATAAREFGRAVTKLVVWIVVYVVVAAIINGFLIPYLNAALAQIRLPLPSAQASSSATSASAAQTSPSGPLTPYVPYINILLALAFGYEIVNAFANVMYWSLRMRYAHSTAAAIRSMTRLIGLGAMVAAIAGGVAGGAAGVALGGFLALVIGFATQQVLGQAIAGLYILLARPFKHGDVVNIGGDQGPITDITTLFTIMDKGDQIALIPNNTIVGSKIYIIKPKQTSQ